MARLKIKSIQNIKHRIPISQRPKHVDKRKQFGHFETDLIMFSNHKDNILLLQERKSKYVFLAKQNTKAAETTISQLKQWLTPLPSGCRRSLTQDNGPEFFQHYQLNDYGIKTYFCNPHSPWQKGGVENMNERIMRFIPLKIKADSISCADMESLSETLNNTPRKCLAYKTPFEVFSHYVYPLHLKCESTQ